MFGSNFILSEIFISEWTLSLEAGTKIIESYKKNCILANHNNVINSPKMMWGIVY